MATRMFRSKRSLMVRKHQTNRQQILFVHGWWGGPWVWDRLAASLSEAGYVCETIDLYADQNSVNGSFVSHLDKLSQATSQMDKPILIGHSAGGLLIQKLLERISVPAAVLIASAPPQGIFSARSWALIRALLKYAPTVVKQKPLLPSREDMYALNLNGLNTDEQAAVYDKMVPISAKEAIEVVVKGVAVDASRIQTPILVLNGTQDRLTLPGVAKQIANKHHATYREYPDNAHYLMREFNSHAIAIDIDLWLRDQLNNNDCSVLQYEERPSLL